MITLHQRIYGSSMSDLAVKAEAAATAFFGDMAYVWDDTEATAVVTNAGTVLGYEATVTARLSH